MWEVVTRGKKWNQYIKIYENSKGGKRQKNIKQFIFIRWRKEFQWALKKKEKKITNLKTEEKNNKK